MLQMELHDHLVAKKGSWSAFQWAKIVFTVKVFLVSWKSSSHVILSSVLFPFD